LTEDGTLPCPCPWARVEVPQSSESSCEDWLSVSDGQDGVLLMLVLLSSLERIFQGLSGDGEPEVDPHCLLER